MFKALFRVRLEALKSWLTGSTRTKTAQSKSKLYAFAALMIFAIGSLAFLFWHICDTVSEAFHIFGFDWMYFTIISVLAFILMFIGSVFTAKAQLFDARDNDLLLSMPIKPRHILISRMFMLWVIAFLLDLLCAVPALAVWWHRIGMGFTQIASFILIIIISLPLVVLALSAFIGWLISLATAHIRRKSLATTVFTLIFAAGYMFVYTRFNALLENAVENAGEYAEKLGSVSVLYNLGKTVSDGNIVTALIVTAVTVALFVAVCEILTATFIKTATDRSNGKKAVYVEKKAKIKSPKAALFKRDIAYFFGCPAYLLNAGLGAIVAPIGAIVLLVKSADLRLMFSGLPSEALSSAFGMLPLVLCMVSGMITVTAPSISLEGRTLWINRSLPVSTADILTSKLAVHYVIALPPVLLLGVSVSIALGFGPGMVILSIIMPAVFTLFVGIFGLYTNLRHPYFTWINETQAVKSSVSVLITMFGSIATLIIPFIMMSVFAGFFNTTVVCWIFTVIIAAATVFLCRLTFTKGTKIYEELIN